MNITIIQIGKTKPKYLQEAENEYLKRLQSYAKIQIITLKSAKRGEIKQIKEEEGHQILQKIPKNSFVIALDENGKQMKSADFASFIDEKLQHGGGNITFIIGGCYGLAEFVLDKAELALSFSTFTFPHEMIRTILYEQIYRCFTLIQGKTYHY